MIKAESGNLGNTRELLDDLIGYGCPIVLCTPHNGYGSGKRRADLSHPSDWQTAEPDPAVVGAYIPGVHTPALVSGHILDAIDVDTKNGADLQAIIRSLDDHGVVIVGADNTPSGGAHLFVAGTGICTSNKPVNGVDFRGGSSDGSGRGLIYLPGANRPKYPGKDYQVAVPIDWDALSAVDLDEQRAAIWSFLESVGIQPRLSATEKAKTVEGEPLSTDGLPPEVADEIGNPSADVILDRSERFHALVGYCYHNGLTQGQTVTALTGWCEVVGKYVGRVEDEVARSWTKVSGPDGYVAGLTGGETAAAGFNDADWWGERDYLRYIQQAARAHLVSPSALLGVILCRTAAEITPRIVLPPIVGGKGNLNVYCAVAGPSGGGKSAAGSLADNLRTWNHATKQPGSGEGLGHLYGRTTKGTDGEYTTVVHTERVMLNVDEVDTLTAVAGRSGATLLPTLRTAWSGGTLGHAYVDPTKRVEIPAGTYRLAMVVGVQPRRARDLFEDDSGGTPQRFFWATATDPTAPDDTPEPPAEPMPWRVPAEATKRRLVDIVLQVDQGAVDEIQQERREAIRAPLSAGSRHGHHMYTRLKVAALLGILDGRLEVSADDWNLAGRIMKDSRRISDAVQRILAADAAKVIKGRAEVKAKEAVVVDEKRHQHNVLRVAKAIGRNVHKAGSVGLSRKEIRHAVAKRDRRDYLDGALALAVELRYITETKVQPPQHARWLVTRYIPGDVQP